MSDFALFWYNVLQNNWSIVAGLVVAFILYRFAKASFNLILTLVFVAIAISLLTGVGLIPPLDGLVEWIKEAAQDVRL